jgi:simple sugar transport system ATP-binding protein
MPYAIELLEVTKSFPGVRANDRVTLQVEEGSIHALLGENGAGKSTLMGILFGLHPPDSGTIRVRGREVRIPDPNAATALGIGMVHQHFRLVPAFTVAENVALGREPRRAGLVDRRRAAEQVRALSARYGLAVDPEARVEDVSVGMQQRVEILKMLYRDAEILILDEPTAVLTPQETLELLAVMRRLVDEGKTVLFITHKLKEITAAADTCTVLRRGRVVATRKVAGTSGAELAELMVGRAVTFHAERAPARPGAPRLAVERLHVRGARGTLALRDVSLEVRAGEILGVCGVEGNGQAELVQAVTGMAQVERGVVRLGGRDVTRLSVRERIALGLSHVPEDRQRFGLVLDMPVDQNLVLHGYDRPPFSRAGLLDFAAIRAHAERLVGEFDVRCGQGGATLARALSGGNQQKAVLARELSGGPDVLVVAQPTRGLDVGAIENIHRRLLEERARGRAILLVSLELDELLELSDRIAVLSGGALVGVVDAARADEQTLGLMMTGGTPRSA